MILLCLLNGKTFQWHCIAYDSRVDNLKSMASRIETMRRQLFDALLKLGTPGTWNHIVDQIGMFSFTGLNKDQVKVLKEKYHVYLTDNGRISMAGLNTKNVQYFAGSYLLFIEVTRIMNVEAVDFVVRNVK